MYITLTLGVPLYGLLRGKQDDETLPLALSALCYVAQGMFTFSICLVTPMFWAALGMLTGQLAHREAVSAQAAGKEEKEHESEYEKADHEL